MSVSASRVDSIGVESAELKDLPVVVTDLSTLRLAMGGTLDGILGYSYLKDFKVTIDYRKSVLCSE